MGDAKEMLAQQQRELERIRNRRKRSFDTSSLRKVLNILFLALAIIGFALYFTDDYRHTGIIIIVIGMMVKIIEFFVRFLF